MASPGTTSTGVGILDPMDPNQHGAGCFNGFTGNVRELMLLDSFQTGVASKLQSIDAPLPMAGVVLLARDANGGRTVCTLGSVTTPPGSGNVPANGNQVGLRAISSNSDFDWLMWIDSPP